MKKISILGSTGSIGRQVLEIVRLYPEKFDVVGLSAGKNINLLKDQIDEFRPKYVSVSTEKLARELSSRVHLKKTKIFHGEEGLQTLATLNEVNEVVCAVVGVAGFLPSLKAVKAGKRVALANKESLVMGGEIIMKEAKENNAFIIPLDSEHCSLFQIIKNEEHSYIKKVYITASGGPFLNKTREELERVTVKEALAHPVWSMGNKISIDSATMMNKAFEIIEARWLFDLDPEKIDVLIHPQSLVHSLVEFIDGTVKSVMFAPDMKIPIFYSLNYPKRYFFKKANRLNLEGIGELSFLKVDIDKFPAIQLAYDVLKEKGTLPAVMVSANDVAVYAFLKGEIKFTEITKVVYRTVSEHDNKKSFSPQDLIDSVRWAEAKARDHIKSLRR